MAVQAQSAEHFIQLAKTLPPRLQKFLSRYPPPSILPTVINNNSAIASKTTNSSSTLSDSSSISNNSSVAQPEAQHPQRSWQNPFLPHRHPITQLVHDPIYSLRRQADLFKLAREHGVEELLPHSPHKGTKAIARKEALGLRVRGTGIGQRVKGKIWERQLPKKMERRKEAMEEMPKMIRDWRESGRSRGWKKWPK
jgi:large subunit ribosomal protein L25